MNNDKEVIENNQDENQSQEINDELSLRPSCFKEFIGQPRVVNNLKIYISAAKERKDTIDHILFSGLPGLGKTTLAQLVSNEFGTGFASISGPALERPGDLAGILTNLKQGDVLFIDEIHRLPITVEEKMYSAMEDYELNVVISDGPRARTLRIPIEPFTLVGATTREGLLSEPFRSRFGVHEKLEPYPNKEIIEIINRSAQILKVKINPDAANLISSRTRGIPRIANQCLRRIRDLAQIDNESIITVEIAHKGMKMLGIDEKGLSRTDIRILNILHSNDGKPVGLRTIATTIGEKEDTVEFVYEPYLVRIGFIRKTNRGRLLTKEAYKHLGDSSNSSSGDLFNSPL